MGFASGSISFRRFAVVGAAPAMPDQSLLDKLSANALRPGELGAPEEVEYGWGGGRHVLDGAFGFDHNVFADAMHFALRIDTNKVPGELKKAYRLMEEETLAAGNPSGFISKTQRKDAKDTVRRKLEEELRSGKLRRSRMLPVLWDLPSVTLYCAASGAAFEKLADLFERTFELKLVPLTAGSLALRLLEPRGRRRDYEDFRPTRFAHGPEGESQHPEYPWVAKGPEPKDFLGNEFLLWLWHEADSRTGTIATEAAGEVTAYIDRALDLDCAYGQTGRDSLRGEGPARMPEAKDGLRTGKVPRKAGLIVDAGGIQSSLTLSGEALAVGGLKLPNVEESDSPRGVFEERVGMLRELCRSVDALFDMFLRTRASSAWEGYTSCVRRWIVQTSKAAA